MRSRKLKHLTRALISVSILAVSLHTAHAQNPSGMNTSPSPSAETFQPILGQQGKDVIWVPTGQSLVERMLAMAKVTPQDYVVDLGSGDGRTVIAAAKMGARAHGIEYNPDLVQLSKQSAAQAGVSDKASFTQGDIFESDFSEATVVTLFLLPNLNLKLRPILLDMKPGTRVVSNSFTMGDWTPDDSIEGGSDCTSFCRAYLWIVPEKVAGSWQLGNDTWLTLNQTYQELTGELRKNGSAYPLTEAKIQGSRLSFTANGETYTAHVSPNHMTGQNSEGKTWSATRKP